MYLDSMSWVRRYTAADRRMSDCYTTHVSFLIEFFSSENYTIHVPYSALNNFSILIMISAGSNYVINAHKTFIKH